MIFLKITKKIWLEMVIFHFLPVYMEVGDHR